MPNKNKKFNWLKKFIATFAIFFIVLEISSFILLYPKTANAVFGVGDQTFATIVADIPSLIWRGIDKVVRITSAVAFKNTIKNFMNRIAYDAAVYVASGGKGQKPMFMTKDWYKVLREEADKEYGDAVDRLVRTWIDGVCTYPDGTEIKGSKCTDDSDCFKQSYVPIGAGGPGTGGTFDETIKCVKPNISLCDQPSPIKIKLGIWVKEARFPRPYTLTEQQDHCPLSEMWKNIKSYGLDFYNTKKGYYEYLQQIVEQRDVGSALREVSKTFNQGSSTVSMFFELYYGTQKVVDEKVESKKLEALIDKGWQPLKTKITGLIKTPASLIQNTFEGLIPKSMEPYLQFTGETVADAIGVFFNTLTSQLLKKVYVRGFNPEADKGGGSFAGIPTGGVSQGVAAAKSIFASLKQPDYSVPGHKDILSELVSCPSAGTPGVNECVIDEGLKTAIESKLTLKEAIEQGLIDGSRTFGFNSQGMEPDFMSGYPYRSLLILRKYRIIPVGWELAAQYIRDYVHENWGIKTIMDKFDECGMCATNDGTDPVLSCRNDNQCTCTNCTGECLTDQASPFCGLVDPNWVLKAPEVYCKREGAGPQIVAENWIPEILSSEEQVTFAKAKTDEKNQINRQSVERASYCADEQSCVVENEDGSCKKFGYCMEERPVWNFHGEQCESYYNTCQTFTPTAGGAQVSYLKNTLDYNNCTVDNTGCQWYCQDWDKANSLWSCTADAGEKMNFNKQVGQCDQATDGCEEFISVKTNNGTNLLVNSSFENFEGTIDDANPDKFGTCSNTWGMCSSGTDCAASPIGSCRHWLNAGNVQTRAVSDTYFGTAAMKLKGVANTDYVYTDEGVGYKQDDRTFTFSFYAKAEAICQTYFGMEAKRSDGSFELNQTTADLTTEWNKYSVSYTFPTPSSPIIYSSPYIVETFIRSTTGGAGGCTNLDITIDGAQLEEGTSSSNYKNYGEANRIYLNGNRDTCTEDQVGCEEYTPVAGGEPVTGIITNPGLCDPTNPSSCDQCPAAYVGCKAYREMPIEHMPYRTATDPISFVADTGKTCPSTEVGCEEYTNLDEVAKGGEGKEYYSFIRLCVFPTSPFVNTYYTWEGSDEFGYQLRQYQLLKSDSDNGPCTNIDVDDWPKCGDVAAGGPANCYDSSDTCTLDLDPPVGVSDHCAVSRARCSTDRDCIDYQLDSNPDCTEFYDTAGNTTYRLMSRVVFATDHCLPYRNTYTSKDQCVDTDGNVSPDHCLISGLACDGTTDNCHNQKCIANQCSQTGEGCANSDECPPKIFHIDSDYCISCSAENAGCREYKGSASHNVRTVIFSDFEDGTINPWTVNTPSGMNPSNESIRVGGHSMLVAGTRELPPPPDNRPSSFAYTDVSLDLHKGKSYIISFWAKGAGGATDINASFVYDVRKSAPAWGSAPNKLFPGQGKLKADQWNRYILGPLYYDEDPPAEIYLAIFSEAGFYIDSITFQETIDDLYFIKDSYLKCSGYENCEHYKNRAGDDHYLKSFNKLCPVNKVGCELAIKTQNSENADRDRYVGKGARLRGDVSGDGKVGASDAALVLQYLAGTKQLTAQEQAAADANSDGIISAADPPLILQFAVNSAEPDPKWSDVWVPSDELTFVVNNPAVYCSAQAKGCLKFGWPKFDKDGNVSNFNTVYLLNQPDQYIKTLCSHGDIGCAEYATDDGQYFYFKNPGDTTCEYRKIAGYNAEGWYKKDSTSLSPDCPVKDIGAGVKRPYGVCSNDPNTYCDTDDECGNWQAHCIHWVGTCPGGKSGCSEYRDPDDPVATNAATCSVTQAGSCRSYYYLNSTIDTTSCNGMVYPDDGCMLFADQTQLNSDESRSVRLIYDSQATYKYIEEQRKSVPPKVCAGGGSECDSNIVLKVERDRVCDKWLECDKYVKVTTPKGEEQQLCYSLMACNELNERTGTCQGYAHCKGDETKSCSSDAECSYCTESGVCSPGSGNAGNACSGDSDCTDKPTSCEFLGRETIMQTKASPTSIEELRYLSGYSKAGVSFKDGTTIEGYYPYAAMPQVGLGGSEEDDLVKYGDFGDSDVIFGPEPSITSANPSNKGRNQIPAGWWARGRTCSGNAAIICDANNENISQQICIDNNAGTCQGGITLMEEGDKGQIKNPVDDNLDENNILEINPGNEGGGVYYDVGRLNATPPEQSELGYVISFRIRYKDEPVETDRLTIGLATRDDAKSCTNDGKPCVGDNECKRCSNDASKSCSKDIDCGAGNTCKQSGGCVYGLGAGYTETTMFQPQAIWKKYVSRSIISGGSVAIKIVQSAGATGQTFYLDDVSLKPVLKANAVPRCVGGTDEGNDCLTDGDCDGGYCYYNTQIPRSCRLYPTSSSPMCKYTDDKGATYKGWYGYCLLPDPKNPDYCLQWWPVDLIEGESDVFGTNEQYGYDGRFPLYMCLNAQGNYNRAVRIEYQGNRTVTQFDGRIVEGAGAYKCKVNYGPSPLLSSPHGPDFRYRRPIVTRIYDRRDGNSDCNEAGNVEDVADCRNGVFPGICGYCDTDDEVIPCMIIDKTVPAVSHDYYYEWEIEKIAWILQRPSHNDWLAPISTPDGYAYFILNRSNNWSGSWSNNGNGLNVKVNFNNDTHLLESFTVAMGDGGDGGGATVAGIVYLREPCTDIIQVVNPRPDYTENNKAWAERIKSLSYSMAGLRYKQNQDFSPYGSLLPPYGFSVEEPEEWDSIPDVLESEKQPLYVEKPDITLEKPDGQARGGSPLTCSDHLPYSIGYQCSGTMCLGGAKEGIGGCFDNMDCCNDYSTDGKTCEDLPGTSKCIGLGPAIENDGGGGVWMDGPFDGIWRSSVELGKRLFAKAYSSWTFWEGKYTPAAFQNYWNDQWFDGFDWIPGYNRMPMCGDTPPKRPGNWEDEYCGVPPTVKGGKVIVRIGDQRSECINGAGPNCLPFDNVISQSNVEMEFVPQVDPEQVPLQNVMVDLRGLYWDGVVWRMPDNLTWQFNENHKERYVLGWQGATCSILDEKGNPYLWYIPALGECQYRPIIRLIDNWDWCSGSDAQINACRAESPPNSCRYTDEACDTYFDSGIVIHMKPTS